MTDDWRQRIDALQEELIRRDDPAAWVREADAVDASLRYPHLALRGPVFGVAVLDPAAGERWRLLKPVVDPMPQVARDSLNSHLWFAAKDGPDDPAVRRELLAAVALLDEEPVNEVAACGVRYRVVRADEFARGDGANLEPPRPTDPQPTAPCWERPRRYPPGPDVGFVLDPGHDEGPMAGATRLGLRDFSYVGARVPDPVRADSERAVDSHPDIVLLPVSFGVVERGPGGWEPSGGLAATPHEARRQLYDGMAEVWAVLYRYDDATRAVYAKAAEEFRALGRADEVSVADRHFRLCRVERMLRMGPDGPEPARPSDHDEYGPIRLHPTMDENGKIAEE
ncbi:DUF5954 family protein [Streptomyces cinnabarinus]|uniref:DUF5954 family protein n=1 Tax=Streptomyces cinnabarinus TaxID=67287 RepID=A0ABY7KK53_9ACTN|nr:DUF5954 family protein [Streptomyces cinnabarinus]WAZ24916.1 DUF5954 family protein [Streptomyces cinnabarinus]